VKHIPRRVSPVISWDEHAANVVESAEEMRMASETQHKEGMLCSL
jgi:hypothetical protein